MPATSSVTSFAHRRPDPAQYPTSDPLDALRSNRVPSGYHGVEVHNDRYRAREPFSKRALPCRDTPREAAADLLAWWHRAYGDHWLRFYKKRLAPPWRAERTRSGRWRLVVYVRGYEWRPSSQTHADKAGVKRYYANWARERYGRAALKGLRQAE